MLFLANERNVQAERCPHRIWLSWRRTCQTSANKVDYYTQRPFSFLPASVQDTRTSKYLRDGDYQCTQGACFPDQDQLMVVRHSCCWHSSKSPYGKRGDSNILVGIQCLGPKLIQPLAVCCPLMTVCVLQKGAISKPCVIVHVDTIHRHGEFGLIP